MKDKNKKKKKNKKRRILLCLLMICLTGVVLSTSTYAWFTANQTVTVSDINVTVSSANGVQVSVDAINWKTVISNDDIINAVNTYATAVNQLPTGSNTLSPVSTIGEIDTASGLMKMFSGEIVSTDSGSNILKATRSTETNGTTGNFVAFDLFVQVTEQTDIYLTSNSKVVANGTSSGIENAARMGFIVVGNSPAGTAAGTVQAMKATTGSEPVYLWELNNDAHTAAGAKNASDVYGKTTNAGTGNEALPYYGVKAEISEGDAVALNSTSDTYFKAIGFTGNNFSTATSGIPTTAYHKLHTLSPGITKIRVYMWVEGQDVDCENYASGGSITYSLQLSRNTASA